MTETRTRALTRAQAVAVSTLGVGLVGLGLGGYFTYRAMAKNADSKQSCAGNTCDAEGRQERLDARSWGNLATLGVITGGALLAAGAATLLVIGGSPRSASSVGRWRIEALATASPHGFAGALRGSF